MFIFSLMEIFSLFVRLCIRVYGHIYMYLWKYVSLKNFSPFLFLQLKMPQKKTVLKGQTMRWIFVKFDHINIYKRLYVHMYAWMCWYAKIAFDSNFKQAKRILYTHIHTCVSEYIWYWVKMPKGNWRNCIYLQNSSERLHKY